MSSLQVFEQNIPFKISARYENVKVKVKRDIIFLISSLFIFILTVIIRHNGGASSRVFWHFGVVCKQILKKHKNL